ncbi:MAG TPA: cation diffusion facilitator family transporter [Thermomicrobiales bacterium]|nr:cation diffusion facilitator family transporter [Thermomicrobiales bacterium]
MKTPSLLTRMALLAILAAFVTMALKFAAYGVTGSVGLLSDAVESTANLVAAMTALFAIWYASRPVDRSHPYGHEKIEFFSSGIEGILILIAAASIGWYAIGRLREPQELTGIGAGAVIAIIASAINFGVAHWMLRVARSHNSIVLDADGRHLMTDVWTSVGVVVGLVLVQITGVPWLDPVIALLIALNILHTGYGLLRVSIDGLMDRALAPDVETAVRQAIEQQLQPDETYHALRTRRSGSRQFVDFHLLVPGRRSVAQAHQATHRLERAIAETLPSAETTIHIEPIEEPAAWDDSALVKLESEAQAVPHHETRETA